MHHKNSLLLVPFFAGFGFFFAASVGLYLSEVFHFLRFQVVVYIIKAKQADH